ncbi:MAG: L-lactate permease [Lentisphaerae bacterium]|nr:L-lactate permease [Lentisphaerota bacterium]
MLFFAALLPILTALLLMCKFKISPGKAMAAAWFLAVILAYQIWDMNIPTAAAATLQGIFKSLDIIFIIAGALLLLNVMRQSGAMQSINRSFSNISNDRRIQVLVIAWLFSGFIEGASGFGAAPALAAPLLASLGFPPLIAVITALICNTLPVPFGAVGIPIKTAIAALSAQLTKSDIAPEIFEQHMLKELTMISGTSGLFLPLTAIAAMIILSGGKRKIRSILEITPLALFSALAYIIPWQITALTLGPELAAMMGTVVGLPLILLLIRFKIMVPAYIWDFPEAIKQEPQDDINKTALTDVAGIPALKAWIPYFSLALSLLILRMPGSIFIKMLNSFSITLPETFGIHGSGASWKILNNPGLLPIGIIAVISSICWKIPAKKQMDILINTFNQIKMSAIAIAASVAIVQIMVFTSENVSGNPGMLESIAIAAADVMGKTYLVSAPFIGILGTFFTGSCTVSNILFAPLQYNTAEMLNLSTTLTVALQNVGGGLGSMIRISGVIAACATVNAAGKEGKVILFNTVPAIIMAMLALIAAWLIG